MRLIPAVHAMLQDDRISFCFCDKIRVERIQELSRDSGPVNDCLPHNCIVSMQGLYGAGCTILFTTDASVEGEWYGFFYIWKSSGALKFRCFLFVFPWILKFCYINGWCCFNVFI